MVQDIVAAYESDCSVQATKAQVEFMKNYPEMAGQLNQIARSMM